MVLPSPKLNKLYLLLATALLISAQKSDALDLAGLLGYVMPSGAQFVAQLLNTTQDKIQKIAKTFEFNDNINMDDISIVRYHDNGEYTSHNLGVDEVVDIDMGQETVVIIHGFQSDGKADWVQQMAAAYHKKGVKNTLAVDWSDFAALDYLTAATAVKRVGELIADWLHFQTSNSDKSSLKNVRFVGHSLGAHAAGFAGNHIRRITGHSVKRISGLDPAAPLFEFPIKVPTSKRLDSSDASYVEAYHTSSGFLGFLKPLAKQDFYINYGFPIQPGCKGLDVIKAITCGHGKSHEVFIKTINSEDYVARKCRRSTEALLGGCNDNVSIIMGVNNNATDIKGKFYVETDKNGNPL